MLKNSKHERFAQLVANGNRADAAYVAAGFSASGAAQSASRLLRRGEVQARVTELRKEISGRAIEKAVTDQSWVLERLREQVEQGTGMVQVRALEAISRILGLYGAQDKRRIGRSSDLSPEEQATLVAEYEAILEADKLSQSRDSAIVSKN
jgi:hypothetical protein